MIRTPPAPPQTKTQTRAHTRTRRRHVAPVLAWLAVCCVTATACRSANDPFQVDPILINDPEDRTAVIRETKSDRNALDVPSYQINPYYYRPDAACANGRFNEKGNKKPYYQIALYLLSEDDNPDKETATQARNLLQNAMLSASDQTASAHYAGIKAGEVLPDFFLGVLQIGLTAAGAAIPAEDAVRALSAAATGVGGVRELYNKRVFREKLGEAIIEAMTLHRDKIKLELRKRQEQCITKYDVEAAIADAAAYHETASLYFGLALILKEITTSNAEKKNQLDTDAQDEKNRIALTALFAKDPSAAEIAETLAKADGGWLKVSMEGGDKLRALVDGVKGALAAPRTTAEETN